MTHFISEFLPPYTCDLSAPADLYMVGSDQVWNSEWNEKIEYPFFLDFVPDDKKRISYAASFGKKSLVPEEVEETRRLVNKYQYLSMREISGVDILKKLGRNDGFRPNTITK